MKGQDMLKNSPFEHELGQNTAKVIWGFSILMDEMIKFSVIFQMII